MRNPWAGRVAPFDRYELTNGDFYNLAKRLAEPRKERRRSGKLETAGLWLMVIALLYFGIHVAVWAVK